MSASHARLRTHFGRSLLRREGRHLMPTPLAESLVGPVRDATGGGRDRDGRSRGFDPAQTALVPPRGQRLRDTRLLRPLARHCSPGRRPHVQLSVTPVNAVRGSTAREQADLLILPREIMASRPGSRTYPCSATATCSPSTGTMTSLVTPPMPTSSPADLRCLQRAARCARQRSPARISASTAESRSAPRDRGGPLPAQGNAAGHLIHEKLARLVCSAARLRIVEPLIPLRRSRGGLLEPRHTVTRPISGCGADRRARQHRVSGQNGR